MSDQTTPKPKNPIQEQLRADMFRRQEDLRAQFAALDDGNVRKIPEEIFVRDFLPLFSGDKSIPPPTRISLLQTWYLIAGTNAMPVNVVDKAGNKIIQIPPVHEATQLNPTPPDNAMHDMSTQAEEAAQAARQSPRLGDAVLARALNNRLAPVPTPKEASPAWQAVFDHYKVGPKYRNQAAAPGTPAAASNDGGSDFDMDLL